DSLYDAGRLYPAEPTARYYPGTNKYRERVTARVRAHALEPYAPVYREERARGRRSHGDPHAAARAPRACQLKIEIWLISRPTEHVCKAHLTRYERGLVLSR